MGGAAVGGDEVNGLHHVHARPRGPAVGLVGASRTFRPERPCTPWSADVAGASSSAR